MVVQQLPLRSTKTMLSVTTDKVKPPDPALEIARELWGDLIPQVVSTAMNLVKYVSTSSIQVSHQLMMS